MANKPIDVCFDISRLHTTDNNIMSLFIDFEIGWLYSVYIDSIDQIVINMFPIKNCDYVKHLVVTGKSEFCIDTLKRGDVRTMGFIDKVNNICILRHSVKSTTEDLVLEESYFKVLMKTIFKLKTINKHNKLYVEYI